MDIQQALKKSLGQQVQENVVLRPFTLLGVGGVADFFYEARTVQELVDAVATCCRLKLPYLVLGGGCQMLISDFGFPGMVILNRAARISFVPGRSQVIVESGVDTARLVMEAASRDLAGVEALATLPGTIGGAVYGNLGNFGFAIASVVRSVTLFVPPDEIATRDNDWLQLRYSTSRLKQDKPTQVCPPVVLTVKLQLRHNKKEEIVRRIGYYQKLAKVFADQNRPVSLPVFKNPSGQPSTPFDDPDTQTRQAAAVIERAQANKLRVGKAAVLEADPSRVINKGKAKAQDLRQLVDRLKQLAAESQGVLLEETLEYVGKWE